MTETPWQDVPLEGVIDFHVHTAPDVRPRWHTAMELADRAAAAGMAGLVLKSHHEPTCDRAEQVCARYPQLRAVGGVTLNRAAGGIDAEVVQRVLAAGGRVIWLPTLDGRGQPRHTGSDPALAVTDEAGQVTAELRAVLQRIAEADAVLATGHLAAYEVLPVVLAARRCGIRRILVNHPEIPFLSLPVDLQKRLSDEGALLERCYPRPEAEKGFDQIAEEIRALGVDSTILATDLGRRDLPSPIDGLRQLIYELLQRGFDEDQIATATRDNPIRVLGSAGR